MFAKVLAAALNTDDFVVPYNSKIWINDLIFMF